MIENDRRTNYGRNIKAELQRRKVWVLIAIQVVITVPLAVYLFAQKNNFTFMTRRPFSFRDLVDVFQQIDKEVDDCLMLFDTRKEQNQAFAAIETIENTVPIRMSESTAVFSYTGSETERLMITGENNPPKQKNSLIIKRVIIKKENKPEEEEISLKVRSKYVMRTYLSYKTEFRNMEGANQEILWLIMEPLKHKLVTKEIDRNEAVIRLIMKDVLHGLEYLHGLGIAHLDLKLANVMGEYLEEEKRIVYKLIDFGFSRIIPAGEIEKKFKGRSYGTFPYKAPEVWEESIHGYSSDVWSLGAMALFMANKDTTYFQKKEVKKNGNNKDYARFRAFIEGALRVPVSNTASVELVDFIKRCMVRDRHERWTVSQLLAHPFILNAKLSPEAAKEIAQDYFI